MTREDLRPSWQPGMPVVTERDHSEWQAWRRERILAQQRERRKTERRIDSYPSKAAAAIIDALRSRQAGGDASSILNRIVAEWAEVSAHFARMRARGTGHEYAARGRRGGNVVVAGPSSSGSSCIIAEWAAASGTE